MRSLLLALALVAGAQSLGPGPQVAAFQSEIDDSSQPYAIYVPPDYIATKRWPVVISLHGPGTSHQLNLLQVLGRGNRNEGEIRGRLSRQPVASEDPEMIVASPLARGSMSYQGI